MERRPADGVDDAVLDTLTNAVSSQRERVVALQGRITSRTQFEAAALIKLAKELAEVRQRTTTATEKLASTKANAVALTEQRETLQRGLTAARRSWVRLGEPVLGGLLLFFSIAVVGAAMDEHLEIALLEVLGLSVGLIIGRYRREAQR